MLKRLFKRNAKSNTEHIKEVAIPYACEGNNEHCDLILQLREKQTLKKDIKDEIKALSKDDFEQISNLISFLKMLERTGFVMDRNTHFSIVFDKRNIDILKHTIKGYPSADIFRIAEELRVYSNKVDIISEKERALKTVEDDIKNIKSKLGIE